MKNKTLDKVKASQLFELFELVRDNSAVFGRFDGDVSRINPATLSIYETINQFSAAELNKERNRNGSDLFSVATGARNDVWLVPFFSKMACKDSYPKEIRWSLSKIKSKDRDIEFYLFLSKLTLDLGFSKDKADRLDCFFHYISEFAQNADKYSKISLLDEVIKKHKEDYKQFFFDRLLGGAFKEKKEWTELVISLYAKNGEDLTKEDIFDRAIRRDEQYFWVSQKALEVSKGLTEIGFKFFNKNEKFARQGNMSLLTQVINQVLDSGHRKDLDFFLLVIKNIDKLSQPTPDLQKKQDDAIKELSSKVFAGDYNMYADLPEECKKELENYSKRVLFENLKLLQEDELPKKMKVKI